MKQSIGWNAVVSFDEVARHQMDKLAPEQKAEHVACSFANHFIDIFNTSPLSTRLACVAKLWMMVQSMTMAAFIASRVKLPYVEPSHLTVESNGKRLRQFNMLDEKPESKSNEGPL